MSFKRIAHNDTHHFGATTRVHHTDDNSSQIVFGDAEEATKGGSITAYLDPTYGGIDFASNCYFDGTNWIKFDATKPAHSLYHSAGNDRTSVWRSAVNEAQGEPIANWVEHTILESDVVGGLALLNNDGDILVVGNKIYLTRNIGGDIGIYERTSGEIAFQLNRVSSNDFVGFIFEGGSPKKIITESSKNVVNGFSELVGVPASAGATGTAGQIAYDSSYFYVCITANTWERTALSSW